MAKVISQETFDEVVKESMEEFEMSQEEAIQEAKQQFEAQGVNLSNIIMTCSSAAVVVQSTKKLRELLKTSSEERDNEISNELTILITELDKELPVRVHAGKEGLYPLLIDCLGKMNSEYILQVLETLASLTNGYPDLLDKTGLEYMLAFLNADVGIDLMIQNLKWMKNCITKHEKNRSDLILLKVQDKFRNLFTTFPNEPRLIIQICQAIKKLVSDDDVRVVHGNPHEHARALANETLCSLVGFLHRYMNNRHVVIEILVCLNCLVVRDEFCMKIHEQNGVSSVMLALDQYPDHERINRYCIQLLKGLAGSDPVKDAIIQNGAAPLIISAMYRHKSSPNLVSNGCVCISALALRSPTNAAALVEAGAPDLLMTVLNMYKDNHVILKQACSAIRNQVSRSPQMRDEYIQLGIEDLLNELKEKTGNLEFESKSVLRDLGCDVKLNELWRGNGQQLAD